MTGPGAPASPLLTAIEAAAYLRVSRSFITRHAAEIGCIRIGVRPYFRRQNLDAWLARHEQPPAAEAPVVRPRRLAALPRTGTNPVTGERWGFYDDMAARS